MCSYRNGCRCAKCKKGHNKDQKNLRVKRFARRDMVEGRLVATLANRHGSLHTYKNHGCRCEPCTEANSQATKAWRMRSRGSS